MANVSEQLWPTATGGKISEKSFYTPAIVLLGGLALWGLQQFYSWFFTSLLGIVIFGFLRRRSRFQVPWLLELFLVFNFLCFGVAAFYFRATTFTGDAQSDASAIRVLWLALAGAISFSSASLAVIHFLTPLHRIITPEIWGDPLPKNVIWKLYFVGAALNLFISPIVPQNFRVLAISFGNLEIVAIVIWIYQSLHGSRGFKRSDLKLGLIGLSFWALRSVVSSLFGGTAAVLLCLYTLFASHLRAWTVLGSIAVALVFAPLVQGVKKEMRSKADSEVASVHSAPQIFATNFERIVWKGDWIAYQEGFDQFIERLNVSTITNVIITNMDARGNFAEGRTLINSIVWGFIPRFIYPNKPVTGGSSDLAAEYADMKIEGASIGIGPISEFYINFGATGVIVGMALMGLLYGFIIQKMFIHGVQPLGFIFGSLVCTSVLRSETNLADSFGGTLRLIVVWFVLTKYLERVRGARRASAVST